MPCSSKKVYLQYNWEKLPGHLSKIRNGTMSIKKVKKVARKSSIPYSMLRDRTSEKVDVDARLGVSTVLTGGRAAIKKLLD